MFNIRFYQTDIRECPLNCDVITFSWMCLKKKCYWSKRCNYCQHYTLFIGLDKLTFPSRSYSDCLYSRTITESTEAEAIQIKYFIRGDIVHLRVLPVIYSDFSLLVCIWYKSYQHGSLSMYLMKMQLTTLWFMFLIASITSPLFVGLNFIYCCNLDMTDGVSLVKYTT